MVVSRAVGDVGWDFFIDAFLVQTQTLVVSKNYLFKLLKGLSI
jgi:hypothetical protein